MNARICTIVLAFTMLLAFAAIASGQVEPDGPPPGERGGRMRPNLLRELGLRPEQLQQIRKYNIEHRQEMRDAQVKMREANRALDQAIYSEKVEQSIFDQRLKEFQEAQAEVARHRFESELALRKLLTPEQLVKFRELRQRFAENRGRRQQGPPNPR